VLKHDFHVFIRQTQVEDDLRTLGLLQNVVVVEQLNVLVELFDVQARVVNGICFFLSIHFQI